MTIKKKAIMIIAIFCIFSICLALSYFIFSVHIGQDCTESMLYGNDGIDTIQNSKDEMKKRGIYVDEFEEKYNAQRIFISGKDDYQIPASFFAVDGIADNDTVILLHGQTGDRTSTYDAAEIFFGLGMNVLAVDLRNSGISDFEYITFGYLEKNDLLLCVDYIKKLAPNKQIGCYGQSMGAATIGLYLGTAHAQEQIDFAIMDSSYDNMTSMLAHGLKERGQDIPIEEVAEWCSDYMMKKYSFRLDNVNIVAAMENNLKVPTLIIQGERDTLCTPNMGKSIYSALPVENNESELWCIDAPHVLGIVEKKEEYSNKLKEFLAVTLLD